MDMFGRWIRQSRWMVVCAAVVVAAGCGDPEDPGDQPDVGFDADFGPDAGDADVGEDVREDVDDGPEYASDDGVDGVDDNCPDLSNPDQVDRSRDGIGDACDNFPNYHDPTNPRSLEVIDADEGPPNDSMFDASSDWELDLPAVLEGTIDEPGDMDFYYLEIDEPTTLLIHAEAQTNSLWPAVMVGGEPYSFGTRGTTEHFSAIVASPGDGQSEVRDLRLPLPGEYYVAITDFANFSAEQANVGGSDYQYRLSLTEPPLPETQPVSLPAPQQVVPYDRGEAHVFTVDVAGEDALQVEATGAPRNQLSVVFPSIQILDSETGETLAFTIEEQVDVDSFRNELTMKLGEKTDRVDVLVEAHTSIGQNDIVVEMSTFDKSEHQESAQDPRWLRDDYLLWMRPASTIESMIGPPVAEDDTTLAADEDNFLIANNPGDFIRVEANPVDGSPLIPELGLGNLDARALVVTPFSRSVDYWHAGRRASEAGDSNELSAYITDDNRRESVIHVRHSGNAGADIPVGGPDYTYDLNIESLDPRDVLEEYDDEFPVEIPVELDSGEQGLYGLEMETGYEYDVVFEGGGFNREVEVIDLGTGELIDADRSSVTFLNRPDQKIVLGVRDENGVAIEEDDEVVLDVAELGGPNDIDVPDTVTDDMGTARDHRDYRFTASAGEIVEIRTHTDEGVAPTVDLYADSDAAVVTESVADGTGVVARADEETEMMARISRATDESVQFEAEFAVADAEEIDEVGEVRGQLDGQKGTWWRMGLEDDRRHVVNVAGETDGLSTSVYDAGSMELLHDGEKSGVFDTRDTNAVYVVAYDGGDELGDGTDIGVSVAPIRPLDSEDGSASVEFQDGVRPSVVAFETAGPGLTNVDLEPEADREVATRMFDIRYHLQAGIAGDGTGTTTVNHRARRLRAVAAPTDADQSSWSTEVGFDHLDGDEATELGGDEATEESPLVVEEWPESLRAEVDGADGVRSFVTELTEETTFWAIAMPADPDAGVDRATLTVEDPDGQQRDVVETAGEDAVIVDGLVADEPGDWQFDLGTEGTGGEYVLLMMRR